MFKLAAVLGLVAGGAGYAVYEYTDLFGCPGKSCPLSNNNPVALQEVTVKTSCCDPSAACCEVLAPCCESTSRASAIAKSCCAAKTTSVAAQVALCCDNPCIASAVLACEACAECATCCAASNATAAVAGAAAVVPAKTVK